MIRLNETQLKRIIAESVKKAINETSPNILIHAAEKSHRLGKGEKKVKNFEDGADEIIKQKCGDEFGQDGFEFESATPPFPTVRIKRDNTNGCTIRFFDKEGTALSRYYGMGELIESNNLRKFMKVDDKDMANKIAIWFQSTMHPRLSDYEPLKDWRFWY